MKIRLPFCDFSDQYISLEQRIEMLKKKHPMKIIYMSKVKVNQVNLSGCWGHYILRTLASPSYSLTLLSHIYVWVLLSAFSTITKCTRHKINFNNTIAIFTYMMIKSIMPVTTPTMLHRTLVQRCGHEPWHEKINITITQHDKTK